MEALRTQNLRNLSHFVNKAPRWSPELNAYVLSFGGRVSMTSVKNFQLVSPNDPEVVLLQVPSLSSPVSSRQDTLLPRVCDCLCVPPLISFFSLVE
jgi:hypothetical protein